MTDTAENFRQLIAEGESLRITGERLLTAAPWWQWRRRLRARLTIRFIDMNLERLRSALERLERVAALYPEGR